MNYYIFWIKFDDNGEYLRKPITHQQKEIITTPYREEALEFIVDDTYNQRGVLQSYIEGLPNQTERTFSIEMRKSVITEEVVSLKDFKD